MNAATAGLGIALLPEGAIRELGEYDIELHLHSDVNATVKIIVEAE